MWSVLKSNGNTLYGEKSYAQALTAFQRALESAPQGEKQALLANVSACHLKMGRGDLALEASLDCVKQNPNWAKGQIRLAEAYIHLNRSNDACLALQKALRIDTRNEVARRMLTTELRRRDGDAPSRFGRNAQQQQPEAFDNDNNRTDNNNDFFYRSKLWWNQLPVDTQNFLFYGGCFLAFVLFLHVTLQGSGFGGSFKSSPASRNDYDKNYYDGGNAYEKYRAKVNGGSKNYGGGNSYGDSTYDTYNHYDSSRRRTSSSWSSTTSSSPFGIGSLFDGSFQSFAIIAVIFFIAHKAGLSPWNLLMIFNMMNGRGGGFILGAEDLAGGLEEGDVGEEDSGDGRV